MFGLSQGVGYAVKAMACPTEGGQTHSAREVAEKFRGITLAACIDFERARGTPGSCKPLSRRRKFFTRNRELEVK